MRTLVFAKKELPDFSEWNAQYEAAIANPENVRKVKLKLDNPISRLQVATRASMGPRARHQPWAHAICAPGSEAHARAQPHPRSRAPDLAPPISRRGRRRGRAG